MDTRQADSLGQMVVGEGIGVGSLPVESLLGKLRVALFFVAFAVFFALLALTCCCHCGNCLGKAYETVRRG